MNTKPITTIFFALILLIAPEQGLFAQTAAIETGECTDKATCQSLLDKYESLLKQYDSDISKTAGEKKTLQNQIAALKNKAAALAVQIKKSNAMIGDITIQISDTEDSVEATSNKILKSQKYLATIVRAIDESDQTPLVESLLAEQKLSDFFDNLVYLENLNDKSNQVLQDIKGLKQSLEDQKVGLESEKGDLEETTKMKELQKQQHEQAQAEYNKTLTVKNAELAQTTQAKQLTAQVIEKIKQRLFSLAGVADTDAPNFEEAYQMAKRAGDATGVRPAFLLAILTQESNLGKNVGQCYLKNITTGAGVRIKTGAALGRIMKPGKNISDFISITGELNKDYTQTAVSCPMSFGYGGAMGPGQFIPSTWVSYRDRVKAIVGHAANPWNIADAFVATALYVADYGATAQTRNSEWLAAVGYFSGSMSAKAQKSYGFYGSSAMAIADGYADDIAAIAGR